MDRAEGLGRLAVLARTGNVELALQPLTQSEMAALFGAVASSPLEMPWHHIELGPDAPGIVLDADEDLLALRDDTAGITCSDRDARDTLVDLYPVCDTDASELRPAAPEDE